MIVVPLARVLALADPLAHPPWRTGRGITHAAVTEALAENDLWPMPVETDAPVSVHVARIAWFVRKGWDDPIQIDVGCPGFPGYREVWPVTDGNHRLAAAAYREDAEIALEWGGSVDRARHLFGADLVEAELAHVEVVRVGEA